MQLLSVNVGGLQELEFNGRIIESGINKKPLEGKLEVLKGGLAGDKQADFSVHGGLDKAIYTYSATHYEFWQNKLKVPEFPHGQFGENFTVEAMDDKEVMIGNSYRIGSALFQVTQPRVPCFKLGIKMNDPMFPAKFQASGRYGFYFRILEEGFVKVGDTVELVEEDSLGISVWEVMQIMHASSYTNRNKLIKVLNLQALSADWRSRFERKFAALP